MLNISARRGVIKPCIPLVIELLVTYSSTAPENVPDDSTNGEMKPRANASNVSDKA